MREALYNVFYIPWAISIVVVRCIRIAVAAVRFRHGPLRPAEQDSVQALRVSILSASTSLVRKKTYTYMRRIAPEGKHAV